MHKRTCCPRLALALTLTLVLAPSAEPARAENMDPTGVNVFIWSENAGWINVQPGGPGGPGMQVNDFDVTGRLWGENVGWVSLSCRNDNTCGVVDYGIVNSGSGVLSGYAWSENAGWIDFGAVGAGVTVSIASGTFDGYAWSENLGWISFRNTTVNQVQPLDGLPATTSFQLSTQWRCLPAPPHPTGSPVLIVHKAGAAAALLWSGVPGATGFDVVRGDLGILHATGSFQQATQQCLGNNAIDATLSVSGPTGPGTGSWFLVRGANCGGVGSYDDGSASQIGSRDAGIAASSNHCP